VDGGLRTAPADDVARLRRRAAEAVRDVYQWLGLADFTDEHVERAVDAAGSKDLGDPDPMIVLSAAQTIRSSGLSALDIVRALRETGYDDEAQRVLDMLVARVHGDHLQTAAIFDESMRVLSLVTDPNDYAGPGTGYEPDARRQAEIDAIRQQRGVAELRTDQAGFASKALVVRGPASFGTDPREVVVGVSPGVGRTVWRTLSGMLVVDVLRELLDGLDEEGCRAGWYG
jgi:propanediol dehydratase large subunit